MVRRHAEVVQPFLHGDADGAAAAPQSDEEIRFEIRLEDICGQLKRIPKEVVSGDESLIHYCCTAVLLS